MVDASHGAKSLWVGRLEIDPRARVGAHIHPDTEEAMVMLEGQLEAVLADEVVADVKHGFVNRSSAWPPASEAQPNCMMRRNSAA